MVKKAYIRTLESVIAAIIIFLFIYSFTPKQQRIESGVPPNIQLAQDSILNEIQSNTSLRNAVSDPSGMIGDSPNQVSKFVIVNSYVKSLILKNQQYNFTICNNKGESCYCQDISGYKADCSIQDLNLPPKSVYSKSIFIAPKGNIVRLYLWEK